MSGHSKWHNIQVKKGKADAQRGKTFTKLAKAISLAAKTGGDPDANPSLRAAIAVAKAQSMPKDNIDRAIKRGTGEGGEGEINELVYEGYAPGGAALIVTALTDNGTRTVANVKYIFSKNEGSMGAPGSVMFMFDKVGVVRIKKDVVGDRDEFELEAIDAGASDIKEDGDMLELIGPLSSFGGISKFVEGKGIEPDSAGLEYMAKDELEIDSDTEEKIGKLIEALNEDDDVQDIFTNAV